MGIVQNIFGMFRRVKSEKGEQGMIEAEEVMERRHFPRISTDVKIEAQELEYPLPENLGEEGTAKNIGAGGICFVSLSPFPNGSVLSLRLHLPDWQRYKKTFAQALNIASPGEPLTTLGEVVWSKPLPKASGYEIGFRFIDIYEDDYKALMQFLEDH